MRTIHWFLFVSAIAVVAAASVAGCSTDPCGELSATCDECDGALRVSCESLVNAGNAAACGVYVDNKTYATQCTGAAPFGRDACGQLSATCRQCDGPLRASCTAVVDAGNGAACAVYVEDKTYEVSCGAVSSGGPGDACGELAAICQQCSGSAGTSCDAVVHAGSASVCAADKASFAAACLGSTGTGGSTGTQGGTGTQSSSGTQGSTGTHGGSGTQSTGSFGTSTGGGACNPHACMFTCMGMSGDCGVCESGSCVCVNANQCGQSTGSSPTGTGGFSGAGGFGGFSGAGGFGGSSHAGSSGTSAF